MLADCIAIKARPVSCARWATKVLQADPVLFLGAVGVWCGTDMSTCVLSKRLDGRVDVLSSTFEQVW